LKGVIAKCIDLSVFSDGEYINNVTENLTRRFLLGSTFEGEGNKTTTTRQQQPQPQDNNNHKTTTTTKPQPQQQPPQNHNHHKFAL